MKFFITFLFLLGSFSCYAQIKTDWTAQAGSVAHRNVQPLAPTLYGRMIVTTDTRGKIFAHGKNKGRLIWKIDTKERIDTAAAINQQAIVVITHSARVLAYDPVTLKLKWAHNLTSGALATPILHQDKVIVKTVDDQLTVLSVNTGQVIWRYNHGNTSDILLHASSSPAVTDERVIVGFNDGNLFAFALPDGQIIWQSSIGGPRGLSEIDHVVDVTTSPIIAGNTVFVANYQGKLKSLDLKTGQTLWEHDLSTYRPLALDDNYVYAVDDQGQIWSFNRQHGSVVWRQTNFIGQEISAPASYRDSVLVGDSKGNLHWLSKKDGSETHVINLDRSPIIAAPLIEKNAVYALSKRGDLRKFTVG